MPPQVERRTVSIETLTRAVYNPRKIDKAEKAGLAASLHRFGLVQEIVVNRREDGELRVVGGHQRLDVLQEQGTKKVPVAIVELDDAGEKALNLALNSHAISGTWDGAKLGSLLEDLEKSAAQLFTDVRLDQLWDFVETVPPHGCGDPDETPEVQPEAVTVAGDVWVLGDHRLACGSSTDAETVARVLAGAKPHLMVTDPPYGVEYDADWRNHATRADGTPIGAKAVGKVRNDGQADWREAWALFPGEVAYVWHAPGPLQVSVYESLVAAELDPRYQIIWVKNVHVIGRGNYHWRHEACWYAVRRGKTSHWNGARDQNSVWEIDKPRSNETGHSTQKPIECMRKPIENNSKRGDAVYEPFSGSGTTIIAGEMTGRRVYAIELAPEYVDVAVRRWQTFTGKAATLEGDGRTFAEVEAERRRAA